MPFDELTFHHRLQRQGTLIEVGANKGDNTLHYSVWDNLVVEAFEPFTPAFETLKQRLTEGHRGLIPRRVRLHNVALGAKPGTATLRIPYADGHGAFDEWASLSKTFDDMPGVKFNAVDVPVWTIDSLDISDLTAIKLDAEGFEQEVLMGARRTIAQCRPILSVECEERHRQGCTWFIPGIMEALNYDGYWYDYKKDEFRMISSFDRQTMQQAGKSPLDQDYGEFYIFLFFFLPRENHGLRLQLERIAPIRDN